MKLLISSNYKFIFSFIFVLYFLIKVDCFYSRFHTSLNRNSILKNFIKIEPYFKDGRLLHTPFSLNSRRSIETVIHTDDYGLYDPNCIKYRKASYWRDKSDEDLMEEIRKVRKVLRKIEECIKIRDPNLKPDSKKNAKRTQAQLLFLLHERHLNKLRNSQNINKKDPRINSYSD